MDDEDFLAAVEADNRGAPEAEEPKEPAKAPEEQRQEEPKAEEPKSERPRDEHGRFAPKQEAPEPAPEPAQQPEPPQPQPSPQPEPVMVPLAALHETRDKLKAMEAQLSQFQQRLQPPPPQVEVPDPVTDPEGYAQFQNQQTEARLYQQQLFFSERLAKIQHGEEAFEKAKQWGLKKCDEDPHFNARVRASQDPYSVVMAEFQREEIASQVTPDEFKAFQAWKQAQAQLTQQQQAAPAAPPNQPPSIPPPSLASAPSAGTILTDPDITEEDIFKAGVS